MLPKKDTIAIVILFIAIITLNPAQARVYRWVDENGQAHYSDRVPPEYADKERKEFNAEGRLISVVQAAKKKAADEALGRKQKEDQVKADGALQKSIANTQVLEKAREKQVAVAK